MIALEYARICRESEQKYRAYATADELLGCYRVVLGAWQLAIALGVHDLETPTAWRMRVSAVRTIGRVL